MPKKTWKADPNIERKTLLPLLGAGVIYLGLAIGVGVCARETTFGSATADVWRGLIAGQGIVWAAALWLNYEDLVRTLSRRLGVSYALGVLAALAVPMACRRIEFLNPAFVLPDFSGTGQALNRFVEAFVTVGSLIAAALAAMVGTAFAELKGAPPTYTTLTAIRVTLQRGVTTLSVLLVVAIGTTSWLQRSLEVQHAGTYPKEIVFCYGLFFTAVLLVIYVPPMAEFYRATSYLVEEAFPMPTFDKDQAEKRAALLEDLGITKGGALQAAFATLSPIIGAVASMALGKS